MRFVSLSLAFCGFAVVLWLLYQNDYRAVLRSGADIGGGLAAVVLVRGVILALCGLAWWRLLRLIAVVRAGVVLGLRTVGEAVNVLLPVARGALVDYFLGRLVGDPYYGFKAFLSPLKFYRNRHGSAHRDFGREFGLGPQLGIEERMMP
jgi:hypothetical protein